MSIFKNSLLVLFLFSTITLLAQDERIVTLKVTGQGKTLDDAKRNALRGAIEQAFGTFISSNTNILNDQIVNDEIVSITNGNIRKFEILNEILLPDGFYSIILQTDVSVTSLTSFCKSKGISVEFSGSLFAFNVEMQELNERSEKIALVNIRNIIYQQLKNCFTYNIIAGNPVFSHNNLWDVPIEIVIKSNENYSAIQYLIMQYCNSVNLKGEEIENYKKLNKNTFLLNIGKHKFSFRNESVRNDIINLPYGLLLSSIKNIVIKNGIEKIDFFAFTSSKEYDFLIFDNNDSLFTLNVNGSISEYIIESQNKTFGLLGPQNKGELRIKNGNGEENSNYCSVTLRGDGDDIFEASFETEDTVLDISNKIQKEYQPYIKFFYHRNSNTTWHAFLVYEGLKGKDKGYVASINLNNWQMNLSLKFVDTRTIEELKKIKEYKVEIK